MDKGKVIASGTNNELKAMISLGEKVSVEIFQLEKETLEQLKALKGVLSVDYSENLLTVKSQRGRNNLVHVLDHLKKQNISFNKIYSEMPTLNDVFLEITGKELRD
jgi:ABC-2 type transport system ATP-binding protein